MARGATSRPAKIFFSEHTNRLSDKEGDSDRWLQGITPNLIIDALYLEHLEERANARFGDATTFGDTRTLAPRQADLESPSTAFGASSQKRAEKVHQVFHKTSKKLDAKLGTHTGATGPSRLR